MYRALICGGDMRNAHLAKCLAKDGISVCVCGLPRDTISQCDIDIAKDIAKAAAMSDLIVLPLPISCDGENIYTPLCNETIGLSMVLKNAHPHSVLVGARVEKKICDKYKLPIIDYTKRDDFAYLNAVPTAEGTIYAYMQKSNKTIAGLQCMVTGFGKCAEILAARLKSLGADVEVFARSAKDLSHASALGFKAHHMSLLKEKIASYGLIVNTVPFEIFDAECITMLGTDCVFLDIASAPGGICQGCDTSDIDYTLIPGIPGKYAPESAAEIVKNVIYAILRESGKDMR